MSSTQRPHRDKIFSAYTKSYIHKESEQTLILCLKRLNELEKSKKDAKLSQYIYELQNLSKSKVMYNVLKQIKLVHNLFESVNTQIGTESLSPSLLLSVAMSYKKLRLNKYTYFKNVLRAVCNNIKVYKTNKLTKLLSSEGGNVENSDDYKHTVELIKRMNNRNKKRRRINMLNVYTNVLNNSTLSYILYAYSTMFCSPNEYVLYMCKYILLNSCMMNHLDMLCILHFLRRISVKIRKSDIVVYSNVKAPMRRGEETIFGKLDVAKDEEQLISRDSTIHDDKKQNIRRDNSTVTEGENKFILNHSSHLKGQGTKNPYDEHRNTYMKLLRCIIHILKKRKTHFCENPTILISILYNFYKLNLVPIEIFYSFHNRIKKEIKNVEIKSVALYLHILSDIQFDLRSYKCLYKHLASVFEDRQKHFDLLSVCLSFYSLSKNRHYEESFVRVCLDLFRRHPHNLNDVNITNVIHTMGKIKIADDDLLHKLCQVVTNRIDNISAINLSLIVLSLAKLNYQNSDFYLLCMNKGKELLSVFTEKQLVVFTYGLVLSQTFNYPFMEMFFRQYIRINNTSNVKRRQMLCTICYCIYVERPSFLNNFPLSINSFLKKNIHFVQDKERGKMHEEMAIILKHLRVDRFEILKRKKPYVFDISIGGETGEREFYIDFLLPKKLLRNSCSLNGFHQMKKRHMDLLNVNLFHLDLDSYMGLQTMQDKVNFVRLFLKDVCSYNLNHLNEADRGKRKEIINLVRFCEEATQVASTSASQRDGHLIKNRGYHIFPSCGKIENAKKGLQKGLPARVNYEEPLKKRKQIFLDIDEEKFFSGSDLDSSTKRKDHMVAHPVDTHDGSTHLEYSSPKKETFLFGTKCHGLNKHEYLDERSGKIVITRGYGVGM
eukprot:XP_002261488.1 hypothetical protein, conserved in Plasmodium species [Plasmodium knowlesi strain H]